MGIPTTVFISSEAKARGNAASFRVNFTPPIPALESDMIMGLVGISFGGVLPDRERGCWALMIDAVQDRMVTEHSSCDHAHTMAVFSPVQYNYQFSPVRWARLPKKTINHFWVDLRRADFPALPAMTDEEANEMSVFLELVVCEASSIFPPNGSAAGAPANGKISVAPMYGGVCHLNMQSLDC